MSLTENELVKRLQELGIKFNDIELYMEAITHRSYTNEHPESTCYDRLEFLGDSILDMVIGDFLFNLYPTANSGVLSKMRAALVEGKTLTKLTVEVLKVDTLVRYSIGEKNNVRFHTHINEDVFEAFVAAIYLDQGYVFTRKFLLDIFTPYLKEAESLAMLGDYKGKLQQALKDNSKIKYNIISQNNLLTPDVNYIAEVCFDGTPIGKGEGHNKKEAKERAALDALNKMAGD